MDTLLGSIGPLVYFVPYSVLVLAAGIILWFLRRREVFTELNGTYASAIIAALVFSPAVVPDGHNPMIYSYLVSLIIQFGRWDWLLINTLVALVVFFSVLVYKLRSNRRMHTDAHAGSARG